LAGLHSLLLSDGDTSSSPSLPLPPTGNNLSNMVSRRCVVSRCCRTNSLSSLRMFSSSAQPTQPMDITGALRSWKVPSFSYQLLTTRLRRASPEGDGILTVLN
ncbi:hypothetical protein BDDG_12434, partial [Blastomyces dermatitidis ATCC 18188]